MTLHLQVWCHTVSAVCCNDLQWSAWLQCKASAGMGVQSHSFVGCIKWGRCNRLTASAGFRWSREWIERDGKITHNAGFLPAALSPPPSRLHLITKNSPVPRFTGNKSTLPLFSLILSLSSFIFSACHPASVTLTKQFPSFWKLLMEQSQVPWEGVTKCVKVVY